MKRWYVVQVHAGYEKHIQTDIAKRIEETEMQERFGEILIPSAKMRQFFEPIDALQDQQLFPGYILIEMESSPEALRLVSTRLRVIRFLGGTDPVPLSPQEVARIQAQMRGEIVVSAKKYALELGKEVEIIDGPFAGFVGIIDKTDEENEKLTLMVSIFGRMTPVELNFDQIKQ